MYKNWSLRFLIYKIITEICLGFIYVNQPVTFNISNKGTELTQTPSILIFKLLSILFFILGIVFLTISFVKKEERDWKFYTSFAGHLLLLVISILFIL